MLRAALDPGDSEKDAADALEGYLRRCGASAAAFPPIVAVGPRAALPHARPTRPRPGSATPTSSWSTGGRRPGRYKSDLTRVLVTGKVTPKFEKVYRTVLAAQERGIAAIRPGAKAGDVDAAARSVIEEAGFGRFFTHGLGHGIGPGDPREPVLPPRQPGARSRPGMVVTIEPGDLPARLGRGPDRGRRARDARRPRGPDPRPQVARSGPPPLTGPRPRPR